jgi:hypothetical protein
VKVASCANPTASPSIQPLPFTSTHTHTHRPGTMSLPMHLRTYREKSRDESSRDFFNVPTPDAMPGPGEPPSVVKIRNIKEVSEKEKDKGQQGMEINAVLSVEGKEEVYVSRTNWR